jgi:hypothetical protein
MTEQTLELILVACAIGLLFACKWAAKQPWAKWPD